MTPLERVERATSYVRQAVERLNAVEAKLALPPDALGEWVSLRRNIESAADDLAAFEAANKPPQE